MEKIVIVVGDRKNPHARPVKLEGTVRIGRALSSDVILGDEHVEPLQMIFFDQEGIRKVEVMPGINPVLRNGETVAPGVHDFVSGDEWSLGHTRLQAFNESHAAGPAEKLVMKEYRGSSLAQLAVFVVILVALFGVMLFVSWVGDYEPLEWPKKIADTLTNGYFIFVFVWAAIWGLEAKLIAGKNQFVVHFIMASLFVFADIATTSAFEYLSYGTNHNLIWDLLSHAVMALILAILLYTALSYALNLRHTKLIALAVGIFFAGFSYVDAITDSNELEPMFNDFVKPPFAVLAEPKTVEQFASAMDEAFTEVDERAP